MESLADQIRDEIRARGPQPFAWFMQQALYHPQHGYYASGRAAIGRRGDYFTNVSIGPLFGQFLTFQFVEIWKRLGRTNNFVIVEQGAHDALFARDVLEFARAQFPGFFDAVRYRIVEPFPVLQDRQREMLEGRAPSRPGTTQRSSLHSLIEKVEWSEDVTPFIGVLFSNELLDSFPVNLGGKRVGLEGDEFILVDSADAQPTNQSHLDWIDNVSTNLQRGVAFIIDYGFTRSAWHESLQVRAQHRHLSSPFEQIGAADITMHINWTDIAARAEEKGLPIAGFADQHHFLTGIISKAAELPADAKSNRQLQTLLHPEMLGRAFQVLALSKDVDLATPLAGFTFAREPRAALEL